MDLEIASTSGIPFFWVGGEGKEICLSNSMDGYVVREVFNQWIDLFSFFLGVFGGGLPTLIHTAK